MHYECVCCVCSSFLDENFNHIDKFKKNVYGELFYHRSAFIVGTSVLIPDLFHILYESKKIIFELDSDDNTRYYAGVRKSGVYYHNFDPIKIPKINSKLEFNSWMNKEILKIKKRIKLAEYEL